MRFAHINHKILSSYTDIESSFRMFEKSVLTNLLRRKNRIRLAFGTFGERSEILIFPDLNFLKLGVIFALTR